MPRRILPPATAIVRASLLATFRGPKLRITRARFKKAQLLAQKGKKSFPFELGLVDAVVSDFIGDRPAGQPHELSGPADVSARFSQGASQVPFLEGRGEVGDLFGQRTGKVDGYVVALPWSVKDLRWKVFGTNNVFSRSHAGAFDGVFELANVAWPPVLQERFHRLGADQFR